MSEMQADHNLKWGDISVHPKDIPAQSLFALSQRGFSHVLGNEVAAQVSAWKKTDDGAKASEADVEAYAKLKREEKLAKILEGTLGVRVASGPRVSGIEALKRSIAVEFLKARFKAYEAKTGNKVKLPTGDETITVAGKAMTREALIEAEMRSRAKDIEAEAKRREAVQAEGAEVGEDLF